jgi:hypothetical protein
MKNSWAFLVLVFLIRSAKGGDVMEQWHWRNPQPQGNAIYNIVPANGTLVAVGELGTILTSLDGTNWTTRYSGTQMDLRDCAFGAGKYVVVGDHGTVLTSPDLQTWAPEYTGTFYSLNGVLFANNQFVCVGEQTLILTSNDGVTWLPQSSGPWELQDVIYAEGFSVAAGGIEASVNVQGARVLLTSNNGQNWSLRVLAYGNPFESLAYGGGRFAATTSADPWNGLTPLWSSTNGIDWQPAPPPTTPINRAKVVYGNGRWVLASGNPDYYWWPGEILISDDFMNWNSVFTNAVSVLGLCFAGGQFIAGGANGAFLLSSNAVNWANPWPNINNLFFVDLSFLNGQFVGINSERFFFSSNGVAWTESPAPTNTGFLFNVTYGNGRYVAGGEYRSIWTSTNGTDWSNPVTNLSRYPSTADTRFAYGNGVFVGVSGYQGDVLTSPDGLNWMVQTLVTNDFDYVYFRDVTFSNGRFVAVAQSTIATSIDGTNWFVLRTNLNLSSVTGGGGRFVAVGGSTVATSTNGTNWVARFTSDPSPLNDVAFGAGWFVATTGLYYPGPTLIKQPRPYWISNDGIHWSRRTFDTPQGMGPIAFGDGTFVSGTERGGLLQSDPLITLNLKAAAFPELQISGPRQRQYQIEYCATVASTNGWSALGTVTLTNDTAPFTDLSATNATRRFYRAVLLR